MLLREISVPVPADRSFSAGGVKMILSLQTKVSIHLKFRLIFYDNLIAKPGDFQTESNLKGVAQIRKGAVDFAKASKFEEGAEKNILMNNLLSSQKGM